MYSQTPRNDASLSRGQRRIRVWVKGFARTQVKWRHQLSLQSVFPARRIVVDAMPWKISQIAFTNYL
jgi:hypothetical protein